MGVISKIKAGFIDIKHDIYAANISLKLVEFVNGILAWILDINLDTVRIIFNSNLSFWRLKGVP